MRRIINSMKIGFLLTVILLFNLFQTDAQITMTGTPPAGEYHDKTSITLNPPFSFTAAPGQSLHLYIQVPECQPLVTAPSNSQNYVVTYVPRKAGINNPASININLQDCDVMTSIQYFDGLGRPLQTVQVKGSPTGNDIVQPIAYDAYGREALKYLPYALPSAAASNGSYQPNAVTDQQSFYAPAGSSGSQLSNGIARIPTPFAETGFEASPLNRPLEQGAPGDAWQLSAAVKHTTGIIYGANSANEVVLWTLNPAGGATTNNSYAAGQLYKTTTTDESQHQTVEYKDKQGHIVCKKAQLDANTYLSTYYVYDDYNNLTYVIPPIPATVNYPSSFTEAPTDNIFNAYIYGYHYDSRNRLAEKKLPGKGWEYMVYNLLDQVVFSQDAVQRGRSEWGFTKYDAQGRVIMTGVETNNVSERAALQDYVSYQLSQYTFTAYETPSTAAGNVQGYTNTAFPTSNYVIPLTVNYYDNYNFPANPGTSFSSTAPGVTTQTTGLLTGTKVAILNPNGTYGAMLQTNNYYDEEGRLREAISQNNISGTDRVVNGYNFTNQIEKTVRTHNSSTISSLVITDAYTYDHMGRKTRTVQQTGAGQPNVVISKLTYNEIGQLQSKQLHGVIKGSDTTYLQKVDYAYNERGWLKTSSAPLFAMQLNYNDADDGMQQQFNGNIANQYWGTPGNLSKHYNYAYDALNRLKKGTSVGTASIYSETGTAGDGITYDYLGNIMQLTRIGGGVTNNYTYNYFNSNGSSQLQSVSGLTGSNYHYDQNGNADHDGRTGKDIAYNYLNLPRRVNNGGIDYTYTANGEKLKMASTTSGIGTIDYDNGIVYDNGAVYAQTEEGRVLNPQSSPNYEYSLTDHLGNSRVTFDSSTGASAPKQVDDYYPFGMNIQGGAVPSLPNKYLYNKKELQQETGQYDYGARFYDPVIARWTSVDPLAEKFYGLSPYVYANNMPISIIDINGKDVDPSLLKDDKNKLGFMKFLQTRQGQAFVQNYLKKGGSFSITVNGKTTTYVNGGKADGKYSNDVLQIASSKDLGKADGFTSIKEKANANIDITDKTDDKSFPIQPYDVRKGTITQIQVSSGLSAGLSADAIAHEAFVHAEPAQLQLQALRQQLNDGTIQPGTRAYDLKLEIINNNGSFDHQKLLQNGFKHYINYANQLDLIENTTKYYKSYEEDKRTVEKHENEN